MTSQTHGVARPRRVYVLREAEPDGQFIGADLLYVEEPKYAIQHASRLAAMSWARMRLGDKAAREHIVVPIDIAPEKPRLPPPKMLWPDPVECALQIWPLHVSACATVEDWLRRCDVPESRIIMPKALATSRPQDWAGLYTPADHTCHYSLAYASLTLGVSGEDDYVETIKHEVAHAYQRALIGDGWPLGHGGDWACIMRLALKVGQPKVTCKRHPDALAAARAMRRAAEQAAKDGTLASLPIAVTTESIKRRGLG